MMKLVVFVALIAVTTASGVLLVSTQQGIIPHYSPYSVGYGNGVSARYQDKIESGLGLPYGLGYGLGGLEYGYGGLGLGYGALGYGYGGLGLGYRNLGLGYGNLGLGIRGLGLGYGGGVY